MVPLSRSTGDLPSVRNEGSFRMPASIKGQGTVAPDISRKWGWFVVLGIVLIALGAIAQLNAGSDIAAGTNPHRCQSARWRRFPDHPCLLDEGVVRLRGELVLRSALSDRRSSCN